MRPSLYKEPDSASRANLFDNLKKQPRTISVHPKENQFTEVLAWLLDNSLEGARGFAALFIEGDVEAITALNSCDVLSSRTQLKLRRKGSSRLFPDLSIEGEHKKFHLLVEVKVESEESVYETEGDSRLQADEYASVWNEYTPTREAVVRRVGTLTKEGSSGSDGSVLRAANVTWHQVKAWADDLTNVEPELALVTRNLSAAITKIVYPQSLLTATPEELEALIGRGAQFLNALADKLCALGGKQRRMSTKDNKMFISRHVWVPTKKNHPDGIKRVLVHCTVTPKGSYRNVPGQDDVFILALGTTNNPRPKEMLDYLETLDDFGFMEIETIDGYDYIALVQPLAELDGLSTDMIEIHASATAKRVKEALVAACLN